MGELQHEPFQFAFNGFLNVAFQGRGKTEMPTDTDKFTRHRQDRTGEGAPFQ